MALEMQLLKAGKFDLKSVRTCYHPCRPHLTCQRNETLGENKEGKGGGEREAEDPGTGRIAGGCMADRKVRWGRSEGTVGYRLRVRGAEKDREDELEDAWEREGRACPLQPRTSASPSQGR